MILNRLLNGVDLKSYKGNLTEEIAGIAYDSRKVKPGYLFICIPGFKTDGHLYIDQAIKNGASAILAEKEINAPQDCAFIITNNTRKSMPIIVSNYYHKPSEQLKVIGVTGTNGKTTTAHLVKNILEESNKNVGIIGTLNAQIGDIEYKLNHTTPESLELEQFISLTRDENGEYVVMEVSSHALDLARVDQIDFNVAIYTNLSQDHLDYHDNMDEYKEAKLKLFRKMNKEGKYSIINIDDTYSQDFINIASNCVTYGVNEKADVKATDLNIGLEGSSFTVNYRNESFKINIKLIGLFSVYNALAAIAFALNEGIDINTIKKSLEKVEGVAGRFEKVDCGQDFSVVIDYAHSPDGLKNILKTAKEIVDNRIITVFGCGGDRDRTKRPLMGKIAAIYSDFCIVTSDNPRSEEPKAIIEDILPGLNEVANSRYAVIVDRKEAIRHAINLGKKGDIIIIAGKGHETYQEIKDKVIDFDDKKIAENFLKG
ncbi:UDP-N-acetylmuramoyl-dipeptide--2,6-diaminopimelate ligase [Candidatus Syntrophocurvum alkaliphilum]|uniref:UDP-N-acetylmuramoyl-L-alanyl-D-glutamate--2,6-diaminopimelate ligase n=1 Tax=Candidatus Syntrophocurvum alkaliphilum TaxID=2293317 RepID=A0A6I6DFC5_9FIRM|nr:UDP-N-acetylmuramoyl-L-alanyl-D-glutamate--2,6-diaminopimelate ligase [Candidatus Syntrophocurvum alkaliphilum]QGT99131.1 UDP-N-acetylmuramoyl-dipeptide--2,6-diaminopimelate ligase [Candidatus Syntrophocurvum alkaliphilum]